MDASDKAVDDAIKENFKSLSEVEQTMLMQMLVQTKPELKEYFEELLG